MRERYWQSLFYTHIFLTLFQSTHIIPATKIMTIITQMIINYHFSFYVINEKQVHLANTKQYMFCLLFLDGLYYKSNVNHLLFLPDLFL